MGQRRPWKLAFACAAKTTTPTTRSCLAVSSPPVLDAEALQRLRELDPSGSGQLLERVLRAFEGSIGRLLPQLQRARSRGDMQGVRHVAHTLKSSSASVGALRLSALCASVEAAVRDEAFGELPDLLDPMESELHVVLDMVRARLAIA